MKLTVVTWNINSLRLRQEHLYRLVAQLQPDIICLQETKVPDELFPEFIGENIGFPYVLKRGMKSYNGVAIISRIPLELAEDTPDWCGKNDCRHISATIKIAGLALNIHNFYIPAGGDIPDRSVNDKFAHKLDFLSEATAHFAKFTPERAVLVGDLNIAPLEQDVWSHKQLLNVVSHTSVEVDALNLWREQGFYDAIRHFVPESQKLYTWWSYRNKDWAASDRGRRLDHIWVTPDVIPSLSDYRILREARNWDCPSDHVPVALTLDF
ncbi:MAG: exodeoxyribonuclease III [Rhodospirillales bacterium]|nr:exodeoxyribonuclease III [Rhodospirillales bacterium]